MLTCSGIVTVFILPWQAHKNNSRILYSLGHGSQNVALYEKSVHNDNNIDFGVNSNK